MCVYDKSVVSDTYRDDLFGAVELNFINRS